MRAVVQRVRSASVTVDEVVISQIGRGLLVLVGVGQGDDLAASRYLAQKILGLRIFDDDAGKMNRSVLDVRGELLLVSQFTLWGDCRKGRRPSFIDAAPPEKAEALYLAMADYLRAEAPVALGKFQADMQVALINDGPVTIFLDSAKEF